MPVIIDGHNLIPKIPGLRLSDEEDEQGLIRLLQAYCRARKKPVEVYFDRAAPGYAGSRSFGMVKATFVPSSSTADDAIRQRLNKLGRSARNCIVVTSDRQVQAEARSLGARVKTSEDFAQELVQAIENQPGTSGFSGKLSEQEVEEWLKLFISKDDK